MRVFNGSMLARNPNDYFKNEEYLLADSAYTSSCTIVPVHKKPASGELSVDKNRFKQKHSKARVCVEHSIGILKGRFQSLKELRMPVRNSRDVNRINMWVKACCILNNFLIDNNDDTEIELYFEGGEQYVASEEANLNVAEVDENRPLIAARNGVEKRAILQRILRNK